VMSADSKIDALCADAFSSRSTVVSFSIVRSRGSERLSGMDTYLILSHIKYMPYKYMPPRLAGLLNTSRVAIVAFSSK